MARKSVQFPIPTFLYKYIKTEYGYVDKVVLTHRNVIVSKNISNEEAFAWVRKKEQGRTTITVEAFGNSCRKCYAYMRHIEKEFWGKFMAYVQAAEDNGLFAKDNMTLFLDRYEIGEQDLKIETCKKRWVRREQRAQKQSIQYPQPNA